MPWVVMQPSLLLASSKAGLVLSFTPEPMWKNSPQRSSQERRVLPWLCLQNSALHSLSVNLQPTLSSTATNRWQSITPFSYRSMNLKAEFDRMPSSFLIYVLWRTRSQTVTYSCRMRSLLTASSKRPKLWMSRSTKNSSLSSGMHAFTSLPNSRNYSRVSVFPSWDQQVSPSSMSLCAFSAFFIRLRTWGCLSLLRLASREEMVTLPPCWNCRKVKSMVASLFSVMSLRTLSMNWRQAIPPSAGKASLMVLISCVVRKTPPALRRRLKAWSESAPWLCGSYLGIWVQRGMRLSQCLPKSWNLNLLLTLASGLTQSMRKLQYLSAIAQSICV